ncbi:hypothetical protein AAFF_G00396180, partial [Aldrovandia affinis]
AAARGAGARPGASPDVLSFPPHVNPAPPRDLLGGHVMLPGNFTSVILPVPTSLQAATLVPTQTGAEVYEHGEGARVPAESLHSLTVPPVHTCL